jgi:biopolymer transport protein ExbD
MRRGQLEPSSERIPNLAPMVDVIMVILVFFLLGASLELGKEGVLQTELDPRSGPGEGAPIEIVPSVKIALEEVDEGRACNIYVMGEPLAGNTFEHLSRFLNQRREAGADTLNPVVIAAQPGVRWRFVIKAMDVAVRAGFANVQFAVSLGGGTRLGS